MTDKQRIEQLERQNRAMRAVLENIAKDSPPNDWQPRKDGKYCGWGKSGQPGCTGDADMNDHESIHNHGVSVGIWYRAKDARLALSVI